MSAQLPILYSFRRCPYAMRARMAIVISGIQLELREILLKDKPESMLSYSGKGTVPVLVLPDGKVIDESMEVIEWAFQQGEHGNSLDQYAQDQSQQQLVLKNDNEFKNWLDRYKYHVAYPQYPQQHYRQQAEVFLQILENQLQVSPYLAGSEYGISDLAIFPFVRQFAFVDKNWFDQSPYKATTKWLDYWIEHAWFKTCMKKYAVWQEGDKQVIFK